MTDVVAVWIRLFRLSHRVEHAEIGLRIGTGRSLEGGSQAARRMREGEGGGRTLHCHPPLLLQRGEKLAVEGAARGRKGESVLGSEIAVDEVVHEPFFAQSPVEQQVLRYPMNTSSARRSHLRALDQKLTLVKNIATIIRHRFCTPHQALRQPSPCA
jgi:hypothetical protein